MGFWVPGCAPVRPMLPAAGLRASCDLEKVFFNNKDTTLKHLFFLQKAFPKGFSESVFFKIFSKKINDK